jgi:hypothetical protein
VTTGYSNDRYQDQKKNNQQPQAFISCNVFANLVPFHDYRSLIEKTIQFSNYSSEDNPKSGNKSRKIIFPGISQLQEVKLLDSSAE